MKNKFNSQMVHVNFVKLIQEFIQIERKNVDQVLVESEKEF